MNNITSEMFRGTIGALQESLDQRLVKHNVHVANIVNAETPGYRALGYEFEQQLQAAIGEKSGNLRTSHQQHYRNSNLTQEGHIVPEVFIQPTESIGNDGNTVNVEGETMALAENQIMYRVSSQMISKKFALLRYAITGGR